MRRGPDVIRRVLHDHSTEADGFLEEPQKAFGSVWKDMRGFHQESEAFKTFADIVRAVVLEIWPIAEGAVVLRQEVSQRRLHSVRTAAMELRVTERRLRLLLAEASVISADDPRPDSRAVFDAQAHGEALRAIRSLVTDPQMRRTVGITEAELRALQQEGVLQPRKRLPSRSASLAGGDGQALDDELNALADTQPKTAKLETIQRAQAKSKVSVGRIIAAIRARQIRVHAAPSNTSYHGFKVCRSEF